MDITEDNLIFLFFLGFIGTPLFVYMLYLSGFRIDVFVFVLIGFASIYLWIKGMMRRRVRIATQKEIDEIIPKIGKF